MSKLPGSQDSAAGTADQTGSAFEADCILHSVMVTYREGTDRVTVYPRRDSCCDQMEAWLTADVDAFVSLDAMR